MADLDELLDHLERLIADVEAMDPDSRGRVFQLLDGIDALHRMALVRLGEAVGPETLDRLREDPAVAWLLDAYRVGIEDQAAVESALGDILPYIHSHGGELEVLDARAGVVRLRLTGTCSGCTASSVTLREGVERALRERMPGFVALEVEEVEAPAHPPPGPTLVQLRSKPS
jgi:Fe-S cluster biogenesis protein NfuA